jgi:hypothetical protein
MTEKQPQMIAPNPTNTFFTAKFIQILPFIKGYTQAPGAPRIESKQKQD